MRWTRVELENPILRKARRGEDFRVLWVNGEPMRLCRVMSPTVAYVEPLSALDRWIAERESRETPFVDFVR